MKHGVFETRKGIINAAKKLNTEFTFIELMNACKKDGLFLTEAQVQASMNRSGQFYLDRKRGLYCFKVKNKEPKIISAEDMKNARNLFFNTKAELKVQEVLEEALSKAKQGENTFFFPLAEATNVNELVISKLKELGYTTETSADGAIIAW